MNLVQKGAKMATQKRAKRATQKGAKKNHSARGAKSTPIGEMHFQNRKGAKIRSV